MANLDEFRATILRDGEIAKAQRFRVEISPNNPFLRGYAYLLREVPLMAAGAEHPGSELMTADIRYYGPSFKIPVKQQFNVLPLSFIVRGSMDIKGFFDEWKKYISMGGKGNYDFRFKNEYATTIDIYQTSELQDVGDTYHLRLYDAFPIVVMPLQANWFEDTIHRLSVQFSYTDFDPITIAGPNQPYPTVI